MSVVLAMQCLKKLKIILQSNLFLALLIAFTLTYVFIKTTIIKYESIYDSPTTLEGIITDINIKEDSISFILKSKEKIQCSYYFQDKEEINNLLGKKVRITGSKKEVFNNTIPNTFNYKKYLYNNKIYLAFKVSKIEILDKENIFYQIKNKMLNRINNYDDKVKTYLNLFILGDKTYLSDSLYTEYRTNGIWHLFAVSGMHIGLIILVLDKIFQKYKYKKIIISLILFYFMFLTNFSASVMRATIFYFLKNLLDYLDIELDNKKILLLVAILILLINPFMIFNAGFQYSFLITFSIMLLSSKITGSYFKQIFLISIISFVVSLPITAGMNYEVNLLSLFLNIFYVPFISLVIFPLSILVFILPFLSIFLKVLIIILEYSTSIFYSLKLNIIIPKMSSWLIISYYLILYLMYKKENKKFSYLLVILMLINYLVPKLDNSYLVYYLDVGQGDSSLIISPHKKEVMMIDTGGSINSDYHVSDNTILFLKSLGLNKIDLLIISHGDADHAKECLNIIENFKISNIILNKNADNKLEKEIRNSGKVVSSYKSKYFNYQNINDYISSDENASSIITYLNIYKWHFLFMGDTTKEVERKFIQDYSFKGDFIKLAHHGSKTSSSIEFLKNYDIIKAIISSGRNNIYHHPSEEVISSLNNLKIPYLNTQTSGTIEIKLNKNNYVIKEYAP